jgi:hypothetical protein
MSEPKTNQIITTRMVMISILRASTRPYLVFKLSLASHLPINTADANVGNVKIIQIMKNGVYELLILPAASSKTTLAMV